MDEEKSNDDRVEPPEQPSRRHGQRRSVDVVIGDGPESDRRREDRRKAKPGWQKLIEIVFGHD